MSKRRRKNKSLEDFISSVGLILAIGIVGSLVKYQKEIKSYGYILLAITLVLSALLIIVFAFFYKRKNKKFTEYDDDNKILYMLKGMPPAEFETEMANMFSKLGYKTEVMGGSHDGGVDVMAEKDGEKYLIQCKKYLTSVSGVEDVRAFSGVVSAKLAKKGFFITTNKFTLEAEKEFEQNPRIELIDGLKLIEYYKMALK